jgi:hypothetical protein
VVDGWWFVVDKVGVEPEDCDDNVCCTVVLDTFVDRIGVIC